MGALLITEQQEAGRSGFNNRAWWRSEIHRLDRTGGSIRHPWLTELPDEPSGAFDVDATFHDGRPRIIRGLTD